ncbi:RNA-guided endonuclease IscB [Oceanisphaera sp. IT1-181]|uniref:RNA-guided endonuclease IscB n=1 Tax=Oceanisphaera sp. IT1-181 TaxID=3081199 RepID=UPI0029C9CFAB|nr:RNA-guided endonuclease IscB [Oceanisphaera sp. IT1-181]
MHRTLVLDNNKQPLMPCHPARARALLKNGKAAVFRAFPFTIILLERVGGEVQPLEAKLDPGSNTTGLALNLHGKHGIKAVWAANLNHRGHAISAALISRAANRGNRRSRKTRYRAARFDNRTKPKGWLAPSILSRVYNGETWTRKLITFSPVTHIVVETVRFDMQKMTHPDIAGAEYQQGERAGFELREYVLFRDRHTCQYCHGAANDPVLNVDHKHPRSRGGSNSVKNLITSCVTCNQHKDAHSLEDWLALNKQHKSKLAQARVQHIPTVMAGKFMSMRDAAAVNAARYRLGAAVKQFGLPVTFTSGGQTKFNRTQQGYGKEHWVDAACAGDSGAKVFIGKKIKPLTISAKGHGSRQMCRVDKYGFPRTAAKQQSTVKGFKTGDMVAATVPSGVKTGSYVGRVAVRASGFFNITTQGGTVQGISHKHCRLIHSGDGFQYN